MFELLPLVGSFFRRVKPPQTLPQYTTGGGGGTYPPPPPPPPTTAQPTISIVAPLNNTSLTVPQFPVSIQISGTSANAPAVKASLFSGSTQIDTMPASGTTSWSVNMSIPSAGTYTIHAATLPTSTGQTVSADLTITLSNVVIQPPVQPGALGFMHGINKNAQSLSTVTTQGKLLPFIAQNGFSFVRIPVYWDKWLDSPASYEASLRATADAADIAGLKVIYDFHQYNTAAVFNGGGFPNAVVTASGATTKKDFWAKYWQKSFSYQGKNIWDAQLEFMMQVIVMPNKDRPSTLGYEIINEGPVTMDSDHESMKALQEYIGNEIVKVDPDAWIVANHPFTVGGYSVSGHWWDPLRVKRTIPNISNGKVIYGPHPYWGDNGTNPTEVANSPGADGAAIAAIQDVLKCQIMLGEWDMEITPADQPAMKRLIDYAKARSWMIALWIFDGKDASHRCFNLSYDVETSRYVWPKLLAAMGLTQTGAPK